MDLLISIKPEFVDKIISHEKKYEFRRSIFKKEVEKIYIYSTAPEKKIIGYFLYDKVIEDTPHNLWDRFSACGGISKEPFFNYFKGKEKGYAIKISDLNVFSKPLDVNDLENFKAPQSFCYVEKDYFEGEYDIR